MMPMIRDITGEMVPAGRIRKEWVEQFVPGGSLPAWLENLNGTVSYGALGSSGGYVRCTTGATSGNFSLLRGPTAWNFNSTYHEQIEFHLDGLTLGGSDGTKFTLQIDIANTTSTQGVSLRWDHAAADTPLFTRFYNNGTPSDKNLSPSFELVNATEGLRRRNLSLILRPRAKEAFVMEDDQVVHYHKSTDFVSGASFRPLISVTTRQAATAYFQAQQIRFALVQN